MRFRLSCGAALGYRTYGAGRSVVLLHPVGLDAGFWDDVVLELAPHCRTIAVDLPGHGESDVCAQPQSLRQMALCVSELIEAVGRPPAVVVGCSLGGMVAQAIALERPELVDGLVLANTSHDRDAASRAALEKRADRSLEGMPAVIPETIERWFDDDYMRAHADRVERLRIKLAASDPVVHAHAWRAIAALNHGQRLASVKVPALVVTGAQDRSVPLGASLAMAAALPGARHVDFANTGHLTPYERPEDFARLVADFLTEVATQNSKPRRNDSE